MTQTSRKIWGKEWLLGDEKFRSIHSGYEAYYEEFKEEIDQELGLGDK